MIGYVGIFAKLTTVATIKIVILNEIFVSIGNGFVIMTLKVILHEYIKLSG